MEHDRARAIRLTGKRLAERVGGELTVCARQGQVVVGGVADAVGHGDQPHRHDQPHCEHHVAPPRAEPREAI
jgi:hypothetical protein